MKTRGILPTAGLLALIITATVVRWARAEDYYKGKTIRFVVGQAAGGGYDTYVRMVARHISKHIPGAPATVVENMTGAGSLVSANYVNKQAAADGLTVG